METTASNGAPAPDQVTRFLQDLTALSRQHGLGITGQPELFVMETGSDDDYEREYQADAESRLTFA